MITDLTDFTKTFFAKHTLLNILTRYCIFTSEELLMVMRPYQIAATERILNRIEVSSNYKKGGTLEAGGYIWHTTGSGKTLTSFKTAQMASQLPYIDKVLFVVDRKDLDYQTMKEYDHFEKGAANSNANTAVLQRQLEGPDAQLRLWEPCWLPVPGSQWATPAGCAYVGEPGPGGNEWANQALFDYDGNALPALEKLRRDAQREDIRHGE